jgi:molybdenum cofactor cytidylyltransferase
MKFGRIALDAAEGAILGHGTGAGKRRFKKGHRLAAGDIAALRQAGIAEIFAARLEADDVPEDEAAATLAAACAGTGVRVAQAFTGRANLYAESAGLALIDAERLDRLNAVDEALTIATAPPFALVEPGQMLATVKVIPFAAPRRAVETCAEFARAGGPLVSLAALQSRNVGLVMTRQADTKPSILEKTERAVADRLAALGSRLGRVARCDHDESAIAAALRSLIAQGCAPLLVFGASAIVDRRDVVPAGIVAAGGEVLHFGMPVDPGNLLLLGRLGGETVIGVPGCARSPKINGFDWVLQRVLAGLAVTPRDLTRMGPGGLLMEIPSRPMPREAGAAPGIAPRMPRIAAIVLAAGQSRRMGRDNKLLAEIGGQPMVARTVDAALGSAARPVVVVLGHEAQRVRAALAGRDVTFVDNPDYAEGLSTSLRAGLAALPDDIDGALVCLGDMPEVRPAHIDKLIAAFNPVEGRAIIVPTTGGKRGNPVLWAARFFAEMKTVAGDVGARHLIGEHAELVREVPVDDRGVLIDIDTPEALAALRGAGA